MIAGRFLASIFFSNKMIEKMIVAEWSLTLVWNILTKWSLKWSLKNLDFEKISTILCMTVYTRNCIFTLENWFSSCFYACIHAKLWIYTRKLVFKLFLCMHTREIAYLQYKIGFQAVFTHVYLQIQYIWKIKIKWSRKMIVGKWSATWEFLIMKMIIDVDNGGRRLYYV